MAVEELTCALFSKVLKTALLVRAGAGELNLELFGKTLL